MIEQWKTIERAVDYEVSNLGRVRRRSTGSLLNLNAHKGRSRVHLYSRTQGLHAYVHRLVAEAFIPGFKSDDGLIFLDGNLRNTRVDNLKVKDRATGRISRRLPKNIHVEIIETGDIYPSINQAAKAIGGQGWNARRVLTGEFSQHKGYTFRYVKVDGKERNGSRAKTASEGRSR